jgi:dolichol-phosphate mannosyltransferase
LVGLGYLRKFKFIELQMNLFVFVPTYNEKENIEPLIREILKFPESFQILVVDDLSPDGTGEIADRIAKEFAGRVYVMHRDEQRGRGYAGMAGFQEAVRLGADAVIEMDADFSHQLKYLPEIAKALEKNDIVIGSRYISGGGTENWGWNRKVNSWVANQLAKRILGLPFKDNTSGYRGFRKEILNQLPWSKFVSPGPSILQEMLFHALPHKPKCLEIPIIFIDRTAGYSKISLMVILKWIRSLLKIRFSGR